MSVKSDLHTHTTYCDGANTPEEMVRAALVLDMDCLGVSGHSYTFFDESYCMTRDGTKAYRAEISALKERYAGQINILCGVEQDYWSEESTEPYDYVIGSAHYLRVGGHYLPVDESAAIQRRIVAECFGGDWYAFAEAYFDTVAGVAERTGCDIIGHFDLVSKFNERERLFDERHPRYTAAWQAAADRLLRSGKPFEVNTGAMFRGYRSVPYPNAEMTDYLRARGGTFLLSSDSHCTAALCHAFSEYEGALGQSLISPCSALPSAFSPERRGCEGFQKRECSGFPPPETGKNGG